MDAYSFATRMLLVPCRSEFAVRKLTFSGCQFRTPTDAREIKQKQVCVTNLQSSNVQDVHANATRMLLVLISSNVSTMPKLACSVCQGRHSIRSNTDVAGSKQKRRFLLRKKLVVQILTRRSKSAQR